MMKNPTKPFGTAGKRKIQPVKPGRKLTPSDYMDALGAFKGTVGTPQGAAPRGGIGINPVKPKTYKPKKVPGKRKP